MKSKLNTALAAAGCALALSIGSLVSTAASATTITFSGLAGANGTPVATYTEGGFTVTTTVGQFFQGQDFGNPVPSLFAGPAGGGPVSDALDVTANGGGSFFFDTVDLAANNGNTNFTFTGFLNGVVQFTETGVEPGRFGPFGFDTIFNVGNIAINDLSIGLGILGTSANVDNIVVNQVPGPIVGAGLPGLILACGVLLALARRRRQLVV